MKVKKIITSVLLSFSLLAGGLTKPNLLRQP